jgi:hypothetical protein
MRLTRISIPDKVDEIEVYRLDPKLLRVRSVRGPKWDGVLEARGHKEILEDHGFEWDDRSETWVRTKPRGMWASVVRIAHEKPETRTKLVPLLRQADTALTGKTMENDSLRFHVYRGSVRVWDLTNAGKRGKKVEGFALYDTDMTGSSDYGVAMAKHIEQYTFRLRQLDFKKALTQARALVRVGREYDLNSPKIHDFQEKGVDVAPAGFGPFKKGTPEFEVEATWTEYNVRDRSDKYNEPACYNTGKRDVKRFYRWVTDSWGRLKNLTYNELTSLMSKEGFKFRSFCRMD